MKRRLSVLGILISIAFISSSNADNKCDSPIDAQFCKQFSEDDPAPPECRIWLEVRTCLQTMKLKHPQFILDQAGCEEIDSNSNQRSIENCTVTLAQVCHIRMTLRDEGITGCSLSEETFARCRATCK